MKNCKGRASSFSLNTLFMNCVLNILHCVCYRQCTSSPKSTLSTPLPGVSHLAVAAVTRKQDSVGLTATLSNYVNTQLMDHIAGWQTDVAERQVLHLLCQNTSNMQ